MTPPSSEKILLLFREQVFSPLWGVLSCLAGRRYAGLPSRQTGILPFESELQRKLQCSSDGIRVVSICGTTHPAKPQVVLVPCAQT